MAKTTKTGVLTTPTAKATTVLEDSSPVLPLPDTPQGVMAVGPRVTFHFVQDYNQANSYDYYDVVNVDGTSYIAIQDVPANTTITNADYWVKWNDPNAQYMMLQNTVESFDSRITAAKESADNADTAIASLKSEVETRGVVLIGDSYSVANGEVTGWIAPMKTALQKSGWEVFSMGNPGAGFARVGNQFEDILNNLIDSMSADEKLSVKKVLVAGGYNDNPYSISEIDSAITDFVGIAQENFPNSEIRLAFIGSCTSDMPTFSAVRAAQNNYLIAGVNAGVPVALGYDWMFSNNEPFLSDNFHPTQNSVNALVNNLVNFLFGNEIYWNAITPIEITPESGVEIASFLNFDYAQKKITFNNGAITATPNNNTFTLGKAKFLPIVSRAQSNCQVQVGSNYYFGVIQLRFQNDGTIIADVYCLNSDNTAYVTNFTKVNIL